MPLKTLTEITNGTTNLISGYGTPSHVTNGIKKVMSLPSEHYDFIDYDVRGKTESQILQETNQNG